MPAIPSAQVRFGGAAWVGLDAKFIPHTYITMMHVDIDLVVYPALNATLDVPYTTERSFPGEFLALRR